MLRNTTTTLILTAAILANAQPALADDCAKDVVTAIEKQRASKAFRVSMTQSTAEGPVDMTVDYMPPDRMLQTVIGKHMPGEQQTMLVGSRAFAGTSGAYEELLPQFTQSIVAEVRAATGKVGNVGTFECLGKVTYDGRELLAYRAADQAAKVDGDVLARTIYVDPTSGLPAYNVVAPISGKSEAMKLSYSYPDGIVIEPPTGAPIQKTK